MPPAVERPDGGASAGSDGVSAGRGAGTAARTACARRFHLGVKGEEGSSRASRYSPLVGSSQQYCKRYTSALRGKQPLSPDSPQLLPHQDSKFSV